MRKLFLLVVFVGLLAACVPAQPLPVSPIATPELSERGCSKVSVHIGNRPDGLDDFLEVAQPCVIYSLNNSPMSEIEDHSPGTLLIRRIQDETWNRLPDCMYCGLFAADWEAQARASARYEALIKTKYVPGHGHLNYVQFAQLGKADYYAPMNEPVLGMESGDYALKARWLDAWFDEWLDIIHSYGLRGSIYSFATGEPLPEAAPYLVNSARKAAAWGDIIDLHAYGVEGPIMTSPSSGAFHFVSFYNALPVDARPRFVISEFSAGNGYDTGLSGRFWIADSIAYGIRLIQYPYVIGACAFQSDLGAESHIPHDVLEDYAVAAAGINWSMRYLIYLPVAAR